MLMNVFLAMKIHILRQPLDSANVRKDSLKISENVMRALQAAALVSLRSRLPARHVL